MIDNFRGPFNYLSNFYPVDIYLDGNKYSSVEHAFQAAKTLNEQERLAIQQAKTPSEAKKLGRKATMRSDWEATKIEVMHSLLVQKFMLRPDLCVKLLGTGSAELVEGNDWNDTFWGVCRGRGHNHLGKLLMQVRADIFANKLSWGILLRHEGSDAILVVYSRTEADDILSGGWVDEL
jgi:N-glycosidase YbiA